MISPEHKYIWEQTIANMFSNPTYANSYLFYAHMLAQCRVIFDDTMQAPAGVNFMHDHYNLYINPTGFDLTDEQFAAAQSQDPSASRHIPGFCEHPLEHRLGILKHEMLHILFAHIARKEDRDHRLFNIATDCAINQLIDRQHLPDGCIFPDTLPINPPPGLTAEQYYELLFEFAKKQSKGGSGSGFGSPLDSHDKWDESEGDADLQKDLTGNMLEKAGNATTKSRGNLPSEYSDWLSFFTTRAEVDWRNVLRNIVGQKRINVRKTIRRQDRRLPNFEWIKGRTKDRQFNLAVISDVSGSVDDAALLALWSEVRNICSLFNTEVTLVQVDTQPSSPEKLTRNTKSLERKACGGTILHPAIAKLKEHRVNYDALIVTTDGFIDDRDVEHFQAIGKRVIWLIESNGNVLPSMSSGRMQAFKLKS